ncbi:PDT-domain-containing protein [Epithele typhae]|uniref:PDT-domain-containing protein n=1 Tax=Epithele typhae TaxID=378194 RepID=UPI002008BB8C|nr:PDT-domain-containing protein [Epithele typhae]KAH9944049.1 PDT-domain-containing protein [Epithele typhae]
MENSTSPRLAFLGPAGSYSHQCAIERFDDSVQYVEQPNISNVFNAVSADIPFAVIPQENSVHGTVNETYESFRSPQAGRSVFVRGELTIAIRHCLVVRDGIKLEEVERVMSHEQALGQCSHFLSEHLPQATRMKVPSTSAAARAVLNCGPGTGEPESAAICSVPCAESFDGLRILFRDIQNTATNLTRFLILANSMDTPLPGGKLEPRRQRALVRVSNRLHQGREDEPPFPSRATRMVLSTLLTTFGCPALRVDRKPSLNSVPFNDTYFLELGDLTLPISPTTEKLHESEWLQRIKAGLDSVEAAGGEGVILGLW